MLVSIIANCIVVLSAYFLSSVFARKRNLADFIIISFIFYFAQIVVVDMLLGIFSILYVHNIMFVHTLICLSAYLLFNRFGKLKKFKPDLTFIFNNKVLIFAISVFLGFIAVKIYINLTSPSNCPDGWQYHLSFPATWIRNANIDNPLVACGPNDHLVNFVALTYYPMSVEFYFHWLMAPLRNAFLADAGQVPFYFLGLLAIYSILRKFALTRERSLLLAFSWVLIPNIFKQINSGAEADIISAVLMLFFLNTILILKDEKTLPNFVIFGILLGLFISAKALNIFWAISLLPLFLYEFFFKRTPHKLKSMLVIVFFTIAIGGYSYIKNFLLTKNIFYPITFSLFGKTIMPGIIDRASFASLLVYLEELKISNFLYNFFFSEGLGLQLFVLVIPGTIVPLVSLPFLRNRFKEEGVIRMLLLFIVPIIMVVEFFFYLKVLRTRYFFPFFGIAIICSGIFFEKFNWGKKYVTFFATLIVVSSMCEFSGHSELFFSLTLSILIYFILFNARKINRFFSEKKMATAIYIILILFFILFLTILNIEYDRKEANRYAVLFKGTESVEKDIGILWKWVHKNTIEGKRIAYTGRGEFYPLFGHRLVNDVMYVSVNKHAPLAHFYPDGQYRKELNRDEWIINLKKNKIDLLVVYLPHKEKQFPIEDKWARALSENFKLVFSNSKGRIYEVFFD